ncbi:hypothetical protein [Actinomadura verrucosospora]|uniref:Uncharacterized protein n=1 Tax=Actinomadura verrucosospora TaxID=46165 RepID=A0A7D3VPU0_ACTVE|nr:hypothetical protein [Actinomadura verrucosospora]QKG19059.1 hypothetical protein ACTIVE_0695 [Actinomadura verrucosospora]
MNTPSVPGKGSGQMSKNAVRAGTAATGNTRKATGKATGRASDAASGAVSGTASGAKSAAGTGAGAARAAGESAGHVVGQVGGQVAALPGRVAGLAKLLTLRRLLRAAPVVAAAGAGIVIGRRTKR